MTTPSSSSIQIDLVDGRPPELFRQFGEKLYPFWLDSAGGPPATAQWSFMGAEPFMLAEARGANVHLVSAGGRTLHSEDPLVVLSRIMRDYSLPPVPGLPPFIGGAVGWFGYGLARWWERLPECAGDDTLLPDLRVAFYSTVYAYDHRWEQLYRLTRKDMELPPLTSIPDPTLLWESRAPLRETTFTRDGYAEAVHRLKEYIAAGDIYQANLTQRFAVSSQEDPYDLYLRLRSVNPAPFAAYLGFGDVTVLSASPERFLSLDACTRRVETRPIKGTRARSPDPALDQELAESLQSSEKDRAENLMIVDVHRNDLGRVCEIGSIRVPTLWGLESYATVHHLVSVIEGRLSENRTALDLVRAAFPAGSITGAPKLRAMEIIEELEPVRRGIYTGSIGYLGWDGGMDLSVTIRTLIRQQGQLHYGVGGGIVADSDPDAEYQETLDKAAGLERALQR